MAIVYRSTNLQAGRRLLDGPAHTSEREASTLSQHRTASALAETWDLQPLVGKYLTNHENNNIQTNIFHFWELFVLFMARGHRK